MGDVFFDLIAAQLDERAAAGAETPNDDVVVGFGCASRLAPPRRAAVLFGAAVADPAATAAAARRACAHRTHGARARAVRGRERRARLRPARACTLRAQATFSIWRA